MKEKLYQTKTLEMGTHSCMRCCTITIVKQIIICSVCVSKIHILKFVKTCIAHFCYDRHFDRSNEKCGMVMEQKQEEEAY